jgi:hypothetical protein
MVYRHGAGERPVTRPIEGVPISPGLEKRDEYAQWHPCQAGKQASDRHLPHLSRSLLGSLHPGSGV